MRKFGIFLFILSIAVTSAGKAKATNLNMDVINKIQQLVCDDISASCESKTICERDINNRIVLAKLNYGLKNNVYDYGRALYFHTERTILENQNNRNYREDTNMFSNMVKDIKIKMMRYVADLLGIELEIGG